MAGNPIARGYKLTIRSMTPVLLTIIHEGMSAGKNSYVWNAYHSPKNGTRAVNSWRIKKAETWAKGASTRRSPYLRKGPGSLARMACAFVCFFSTGFTVGAGDVGGLRGSFSSSVNGSLVSLVSLMLFLGSGACQRGRVT